MLRRDAYPDFATLRQAERDGIDYRIRLRRRAAKVAIVAPHGGRIEFGTSEIAMAIAGDDHNFYCFEGLKAGDNRKLHITSTRFDEPQGLALVAAADHVVAIHGWGRRERLVYMGGLDAQLRDGIAAALGRAGFPAETGGRLHLDGTSPRNICNRGRRHQGAQLEISAALRHELTRSATRNAQLGTFAAAVRLAISTIAGA